MTDLKEIKKELKRLKKIKRQLRPKTKERIELNKQIRVLKEQLEKQNISDPTKEKLIAEILILEPNFPKDLVDLRKYTNEQLQKHIEIIKRKRGVK